MIREGKRSAFDAVMAKKASERRSSCSITIDEIDGKLHIMANIPDKAEGTVAAALTKALIDASAGIMNAVLGENQKPEKTTTN